MGIEKRQPLPDDPEPTSPSGMDQLLSPYAVKKSLQSLQWVEELNNLGRHWSPNVPGMEYLFKMQCGQAWTWTYAGVSILCVENLAISRDPDDLINIIMDLLENDIEKYDPARSSLGQRMIAQIKKRMIDAIRIQSKENNRDDYEKNIRAFEDQWKADPALRETPALRSRWAENVIHELFVFHYRRVYSVLKKKDKRSAARAALKEQLLTFDPDEGSLMDFCKRWVRETLKGEYTAPKEVSIDAPIGEEEEGPFSEIIPGTGPTPDVLVESTEMSRMLLQVMTVNFLKLKAAGMGDIEKKNASAKKPAAKTLQDIHRKVLHYQLMLTEQLSCCAGISPLPRQYSADILEVFSEPYYRYFSRNILPRQELTLSVIERTVLKRKCDTIDGNTDTAQLVWKEHGFLEYEVMRSFLASQGIHSPLSVLKDHREKYIRALEQSYHSTTEVSP